MKQKAVLTRQEALDAMANAVRFVGVPQSDIILMHAAMDVFIDNLLSAKEGGEPPYWKGSSRASSSG